MMNKYIRRVLYKIYVNLGEYLGLEVEYDWEKEHEPDIENYPECIYIKKGESIAKAIHKAGPGAHIFMMREGQSNETQT